MKLTIATRIASALALGVLAAVIVVACQGTTSFGVGVDVIRGEGSATFRHESGQQVMTVTNATGQPMEVRFTNCQGGETGRIPQLESGVTVPVPAGSCNVTCTSPPSNPPLGSEDGLSNGVADADLTGGDVQSAGVALRPRERRVAYRLWTLPLVPDISGSGYIGNLTAEFEIIGTPEMTLLEQWNRVLPIVQSGPGATVPPGVKVLSYVRFTPETRGGRLSVSEVGQFEQFELTWNGHAGYASLAAANNVLRYSTGNGWETCEVFIPALDFESPTSVNDLTIDMRGSSDAGPVQVHGEVQYFL